MYACSRVYRRLAEYTSSILSIPRVLFKDLTSLEAMSVWDYGNINRGGLRTGLEGECVCVEGGGG